MNFQAVMFKPNQCFPRDLSTRYCPSSKLCGTPMLRELPEGIGLGTDRQHRSHGTQTGLLCLWT